jgi:hypothetical protein
MQESRKYWYVVPVLLFEYAILFSVVLLYRKTYDPNFEWFKLKRGMKISDSAIKAKHSKYILLGIRIVFFLWLLIAPVSIELSKGTNIWTYFTYWTVYLHTLYFAAVIITSLLIICKENELQVASKLSDDDLEKTSLGLGVVFEIAGTSSIFIAVVNYIMLSQNGEYRNTILHAVPPGLLIAELFANSVQVEMADLILAIGYPMVYLVTIFGVVMGGVKKWPYDFVKVDTPACFVWYNVLFIVFMIFFGIWYGLSRWKIYCLNAWGCFDQPNQVNPTSLDAQHRESGGVSQRKSSDEHSHVEMGRPFVVNQSS